MKTDAALLRILKLAEQVPPHKLRHEDHVAADITRQTILALRMGVSITGNQNPDYSNPFIDGVV